MGTLPDAEPPGFAKTTPRQACIWGEYPAEVDAPELGGRLRRHENTGRRLGERPFLGRLSELLARNLIPGKGGRPRKGKN